MEYLESLLKIFNGLSGLGFLVVLLILYKSGLLGFLIKRNGNGQQKQIDELHEHARVANEEMSVVKRDIAEIKADISFIRGKLSQ